MNHYRTLEIATNASPAVAQAAYRELAKQHKDDDDCLRRLNAAKEIILDEKRREKYDELNAPGAGGVLGNYKILKVIAEGGFGRTYLAEHIVLGVKACIKHAHRISSEDEALLHEEAKAIWDLRHYGIPNIRDTLKLDDGSVALVMSYIEGPTLAEILEKYPKGLDAEHVAWITERVLNILKYLHYHAVVHGDVKPQNIIVQTDKHMVTLVDYGLSAIRPRSGSSNKGYTPLFAAPEQIRGGALLPETDFYSLGMTMIFALGGDIQTKSVPSHTPDNMCAFIKRLIAYDLKGRPRWEHEDIHENFQVLREKDFGRRTSNMKPLKV